MTPCLSNAITLRRGDDYPPQVWGFGPEDAPEIPIGANFELDVTWIDIRSPRLTVDADNAITATSNPPDGLAVNYVTGTVTWSYTKSQSASIPRGALASYVLRCVYNGTTETYASGRVFALGDAVTAVPGADPAPSPIPSGALNFSGPANSGLIAALAA